MKYGTGSGYFVSSLLILALLCSTARTEGAEALKSVELADGTPLELVWVPAGRFEMGQQDGELDAYPNKETPRHSVTLSQGFWMGKYEVTKAQWNAVMGTQPWKDRRYAEEDPQSPAIYISWDDAQAFIAKLAAHTEKPFRLPTEAEWEYACRGGTNTRFYWGDDLDYSQISQYAWSRGNALITPLKHARRVGSLHANPFGLHDMSGNVSEWCQDWHWFYFEGPATDPQGPASAEHRVVRGGSWITTPGQCRSSRRNHESPETVHSDLGFRVVYAEKPPAPSPEPQFLNVFTAGQEGVNTYRIPAMLTAPDGSLLVFSEARKESQEDASPTDMVLRRSTDAGKTWLPIQVLVQGVGSEALMNPCPVVDREKGSVILLCEKANAIAPFRNRHYQLESRDNGLTWSPPVEIGPRIENHDDSFNPGPGVGIQMRSGRLVVPGYSGELNEETDENWHARAMYSDDHGSTWTMGAPLTELSDESQVVELRDGSLMLNVRANMGLSRRGVALSNDGGATWSEMRSDPALNECPCQGSIIRCTLPDGREALAFANPDNRGEKFNVVERTRMTIRLSFDEGKTWPVKRMVHAGAASYSTMVQLPGGDIGLLFEGGEKHRREWIRFARVPMIWLLAGETAH